MQKIIIGTAGHVDHGKSTLVKTLTGVDPDRLPEEKAREMTIDLGFVFFPIDEQEEVAIIDVPGHERFIKVMIAGANSIRLVLFTVAADEGIMPQTKEHFDILKLLKIERGIIVLTKIDKANKEEIALVTEDVKELVKGSFLENAPTFCVSSITKQGIDELAQGIRKTVREISPLADSGIFRMPIDRVFTIKGFGTIVAGTVISGRLKRSELVEVLPIKKTSRIRGIQVHNQLVEEVFAGQRAAFNLSDVAISEIAKGYEISLQDYFDPTTRINTEISLLPNASKPLTSGVRVRLHKGTCEVMTRITILDKEKINPGENGLVMLRLENPIIAARAERYLIRTYSPMKVVGGGVILDVYPAQYRRSRKEVVEYLNQIKEASPKEIVEKIILNSKVLIKNDIEILKIANLTLEETKIYLEKLINDGTVMRLRDGSLVHQVTFNKFKEKFINGLKELHNKNPLSIYIRSSHVAKDINILNQYLLDKIIEDLCSEQKIEYKEDNVRLLSFAPKISPDIKILLDEVKLYAKKLGFRAFPVSKISNAFSSQGHEKVNKVINCLIENGLLIEIKEGAFLYQEVLQEAKTQLVNYLNEKESIRASEFKVILGISRDTARDILDYFLKVGVTERIEGTHRLPTTGKTN